MQSGTNPEKKTAEQYQDFYEIVTIDFIPPQVDIKHLHDNGKLLSQSEVEAILNLNLKEEKRYKKTDIEMITKDKGIKNSDYSISYVNGEYYAIYFGRKKGKHIGEGLVGVVKVAQNIKTGKWVAFKKVIKKQDLYQNIKESLALEQIGKLKGCYLQECKTLNKQKFEIFMSYETGDLLNSVYLKKIATIKRLNIVLQTLIAVRALHKLAILHDDVHQFNIICDNINDQVNLIDFDRAQLNVTEKSAFNKEMHNIFFTLAPLLGFHYNSENTTFEDARAFDTECKLHSLTTFPDISVINQYKNSYILVENQLYHIKDNGTFETLTITNKEQFSFTLKFLEKQQSCTFHSVESIPVSLDNYCNSYVLTKNELYYVDNIGKCLKVELSDFNQFLNTTKLAGIQCGSKKSVPYFKFKDYITNQIPKILLLDPEYDHINYLLVNNTNANIDLHNIVLPPKIQNVQLHHQIMQFLNNRDTTSNEDDVISQFKHIYENCTDTTIKIGYVNIEEYKNLSHTEKELMIRTLCEVDELYCIENNEKPSNQINYHEIKKDLESKNLSVHNKVIRYANDTSLVKALCETPGNTPQRDYERHFISFNVDESLKNMLFHAHVKLTVVIKPHDAVTASAFPQGSSRSPGGLFEVQLREQEQTTPTMLMRHQI